MLITLLLILWIFVSLFLILIILLQRGKGGGLAGALGGAGGSSAFGTKAGDVFTKITVGVFGFWLLLAMILVWSMKTPAKFPGGAAVGAGKKGKGSASTAVDTGKSDSSKMDDEELDRKLKEMLKGKETGKGDEAKKDIPIPPPSNAGANDKKEPLKTETQKTDSAKSIPTSPPPKTETPKTDAPKTDAKQPASNDTKAPPPPVKNDGKKS